MQNKYNNTPNMNMMEILKYLHIISFIIQWSILSMILNLLTLGMIRIPLFILFVADALTMINKKDKTLKKPSLILSKLWDLLEYLHLNQANNDNNLTYTLNNTVTKIAGLIEGIKTEITRFIDNFTQKKREDKKYEKEREINKFNPEIGEKVIIEYTSPNDKPKKKTFKYRDYALSFIDVLEKNGYKNYTKYNINPQQAQAYIITNKKHDIVDLENNKIQTRKEDNEYKIIMEDWPR